MLKQILMNVKTLIFNNLHSYKIIRLGASVSLRILGQGEADIPID